MTSLRVTLLGDFQVRDPAGRKITVSGSKPALLLACLALRAGESLSREELMTLLWGDRGESQARGSLRQTLWVLRRAFEGVDPPPLTIDGEMLSLDPATVEVDVRDFERLAAEEVPEALEAAIDSYRGRFLEGLRTHDEAIAAFLRNERQRLHDLAVDTCIKLLKHRIERGVADPASAATARRLLELDPVQECGHRALMAHYAATNQTGLAIKQYRTCREILEIELQIAPDAETERLHNEIRAGVQSAPDTPPPSPMEPLMGGASGIAAGQLAKPSIAVMPFANLSGDPAQEYFSDGISEDIITALSRLRWFLVIARNSTFVYKGQAVDIKRVGRELGVRYILEGSVRKAGNRLRITAQLIDATSGVHLWAESYDRELTDIFALQDEITQSVTATIEPKLVAAEGLRSQNRSGEDLDAWDLVMRALTHYWRMTTRESKIAIDMLRDAVRRYPEYGPARSMLSFALLVSDHVGWIPESDEIHDAAELAYSALELDGEDPWAHLALGYLAFSRHDTDEAVREYQQALALNPNFSTAYGYLGWALVFDGQSTEAIGYFQQAIRMSPHDPLKAFFYSGTCVAHYYAGRYEEAIEWGRKAIRERPGFTAAHRILCASLAQAGRETETRAAMTKLMELQPNLSISWIEQHVPYTSRAMPHFLDGMRKAGLD